jgi:hypothetical protein
MTCITSAIYDVAVPMEQMTHRIDEETMQAVGGGVTLLCSQNSTIALQFRIFLLLVCTQAHALQLTP